MSSLLLLPLLLTPSPHHPHAPGCWLGDDDVAVDAGFGGGFGHFVADGHFAGGLEGEDGGAGA